MRVVASQELRRLLRNMDRGRVLRAYEVVGTLVEVTDAGDVVLAVLANDIAVVANDHCCVPDR